MEDTPGSRIKKCVILPPMHTIRPFNVPWLALASLLVAGGLVTLPGRRPARLHLRPAGRPAGSARPVAHGRHGGGHRARRAGAVRAAAGGAAAGPGAVHRTVPA